MQDSSDEKNSDENENSSPQSVVGSTAFNISIGRRMDSHVKAGWSGKTTTETGKPIWSWQNAFFPWCVYYSHRTDSTPFVSLIWKAERTEKALPCSQNNPSIRWKHNSFLINGPWMHKTLPLSWHLLTWKKFIQACFSKKHDINISLEVDSRITFHVCLYINQYSLQFNPYSKFYFLSNLTKNTLLEKKEINANKPLVKECTHKGEKCNDEL